MSKMPSNVNSSLPRTSLCNVSGLPSPSDLLFALTTLLLLASVLLSTTGNHISLASREVLVED